MRDAKFAELVFWRTLAHLQHCDASFGRQRLGGGARSLLHRFKVRIHAVDSTVMELRVKLRTLFLELAGLFFHPLFNASSSAMDWA